MQRNHKLERSDDVFQSLASEVQLQAPINSLAFDKVGKRVAAGCGNGTLAILDAASGVVERYIRFEQTSLGSVHFMQDGVHVAIGCRDGKVTYARVHARAHAHAHACTHARTHASKQLRIVNIATSKVMREFEHQSKVIQGAPPAECM